MMRAVSVEPVNVSRPTPGCRTRASPASSPYPAITLITPGGNPARVTSAAQNSTEHTACSAAFTTTVLPAASAAPTFAAINDKGAFRGITTPTTPNGSRHVKLKLVDATCTVSPWILSVAPAKKWNISAHAGTSPIFVSRITRPLSRVSICANISALSVMTWAILRRRGGAVDRGSARPGRERASSRVDRGVDVGGIARGTRAHTSPVAGSMLSIHSPDAAGPTSRVDELEIIGHSATSSSLMVRSQARSLLMVRSQARSLLMVRSQARSLLMVRSQARSLLMVRSQARSLSRTAGRSSRRAWRR